MKIGFALCKVTGDEWHQEATLVRIAHTYQEIREAEKKELFGPEERFVSFINALSKNDFFAREILKARMGLGLPNKGLPLKEYTTYHDFLRNSLSNKDEIATNYLALSAKIRKDFTFSQDLERCFYEIIFYNFVSIFSSEQSPISWTFNVPSPIEQIEIIISEPITKNALFKYIDKNWKDIKNRMKDFTKKPTANFSEISERDFQIVSLRDNQRLTFSKIASELPKTADEDYRDRINDDSVKTAYSRAKKQIANIFKPKK